MKKEGITLKIAMVTTLMPETHYSRYLIMELDKLVQDKDSFIIYANKEDGISGLDNLVIIQNWSQSFFYLFQILFATLNDHIDIIHLQHEINMYGGSLQAILFPLLLLFLKIARKKVIITIHAVVPKNNIDHDFLNTFSLPNINFLIYLILIIFTYIYSFACLFSNVVIVHSEYIKSTLISNYGVNKKKIIVIPHGIPDKPLLRNIQINEPWFKDLDNKKIILNFGYVVKRKGLEYLINAFEKIIKICNEYILIIAGGTLEGQEEYFNELKNIVQHKNLSSKIIFTSFISESIINKLFSISEFIVLPCIYSISSSGPLSQAICYHKPVIATNLGTFSEDIIDGENGFLCLVKNVESLSNNMLKLINNPQMVRTMSENMKILSKVRSWNTVASQTYKLYINVKCFEC